MNAIEKDWTLDPATKIITIIQLTRFGDLLQLAHVVKKLKSQYPSYRLILVARKKFAVPLRFILYTYFDDIHLLDFSSMFKVTHKEKISLTDINLNLKNFIDRINKSPANVAINLSYSKTSNYLLSLLSAEHKIGPYFGTDNQIKIHDKWSQMLYATVLRGNLNPYSLIDLFSNIIGLTPAPVPLKELSISSRKTIILHPFTSNDRKMWKSSKWVETIYKVLAQNHGTKIKIVGSEIDYKKSLEIQMNPLLEKYSSRILNLVGKTSCEELYNLFDSKCLFVGHDSMVGHMASLKQVQTLTISLGNVRPIETTPFGVNNYNIAPKTNCFPCFPDEKCDYYQCHTDMPYQSVTSAINSLLQTGEITLAYMEKNCSSFLLTPISIFKSGISSNHYSLLTDILEANQSKTDILKLFYRISWLYLFNEVEEVNIYPKVNSHTIKDLKFNINGLQHIYELAEFGKKYSRYILEEVASDSPNLATIKDFSKRIDEIDHLSNLINNTYPLLEPIVDFSKLAKANMHGDNLVQLTESSFLIYDQIAFLASSLFDLCKRTINEDQIKNKRNINQSTRKGM